ncbi:MAG: hypothetical protein ABIC04_00210 [Nanoarchaeota archaeon]
MIELFVGLKIPDTVAITSLNTIKRMGYVDVKNVCRELYYQFDVDQDSGFFEKISKVDILVNANKNTYHNKLIKKSGTVYIMVFDKLDNCANLQSTLINRLGFNNIKSMRQGILWMLETGSVNTAKKIAENLLCNKHYQKYTLM